MRDKAGTMSDQDIHRKQGSAGQSRIRRVLERMVGFVTGSQANVPSTTQSSRMHKTIYSI